MEDVEKQRPAFVRHDVAGKIFENDVGKVAEFVFYVAVILFKLFDGITAGLLFLMKLRSYGSFVLLLIKDSFME